MPKLRSDHDDHPVTVVTVAAQALRSAAFYPTTMLYVGSVLVVLAVMERWISFLEAVAYLALFAAIAILASTRREIVNQRVLLTEQRHLLLERVDQLTGLLVGARIPVPPADSVERAARAQDAREDPDLIARGAPWQQQSDPRRR